MARQTARRAPVPDPAPVSPLLTFDQARAYLHRGRTWLKGRADEIGCVRDGRRIVGFYRSDLDAWLARHRTRAPAEPAEPVPIRPSIDTTGLPPRGPVTGREWRFS